MEVKFRKDVSSSSTGEPTASWAVSASSVP
jgi:hypothetical protein